MWNEPNEAQLARIPLLYETDGVPWKSRIIHMHFFLGSCDWYAAEYSPQDRLFFGYAILNSDFQNSEWGYFAFDELSEININGIEVDRDLHWRVRKASGVENIVLGHGGRID